MGITFTAGRATSGTNFAYPATNKIAIDICFWPLLNQATSQILVCDQPNQTPTLQQKFLVKLTNANKLDFTWIDALGAAQHYLANYDLTRNGPQTAHFELDLSASTSMKMAYYSASALISQGGSSIDGYIIETVTELSSHTPDAGNVNANPIVLGANGAGNLPWLGTLYWCAIRDRWATDTNVNLMMGQSNGILRNTLRYSQSQIKHYWFGLNAASSTYTDPISAEVYTLSGTYASASNASTTEMATIGVLSASKDSDIRSNAATTNNGGGTTFVVGATSAGATRRGLLTFDLSTLSGITASSTVIAAPLTLIQTAHAGSGLAPIRDLQFNRSGKTWTEGTRASVANVGDGSAPTVDGVDYTYRDGNRLGDASQPWQALGGGTDIDTTVQTLSALPTTDAAFTTDLVINAVDAVALRGFLLELEMKLTTETPVATETATFGALQNATSGNRPSLSVTYTVAAAGGGIRGGRTRAAVPRGRL